MQVRHIAQSAHAVIAHADFRPFSVRPRTNGFDMRVATQDASL
jgi:hypothetical protein